MAHDIAKIDGRDAMFVVGTREDAWHMLGQRVSQAVNAQQAMELAGLNWDVLKQRNYARDTKGKAVPTDSYTMFRTIDDAQLGTVGADFTFKQPRECFEFVDILMEANGGSHYDSAGALGNGATIWMAVRVPKADFNVLGVDKHESYLVFTHAYDGSLSYHAKLSTVRVVCRNTLSAAIGGGGEVLKVRHTKGSNVKLDQVRKLMTGVVQDSQKLAEKLDRLAHRKMTRQSLAAVIEKLFPAPKEANSTRRDNVVIDVLGLYSNNDGGAHPELAGTAVNLLNAVTEYTDHFRSARVTESRKEAGVDEIRARAENAVNGAGDRLKASALAVIDEFTDDGLSHLDSPIINPMDDREFLKAIGIKL